MTNQEIMQALRCCVCGAPCENCPAVNSKRCYTEVHTDAADAIERLTAENKALREQVPQWINVEDRLPEPGTRVIVTDGVFVGEAYRTYGNTWRRYNGITMQACIGSEPTHWMPLPGAPEGDEHE